MLYSQDEVIVGAKFVIGSRIITITDIMQMMICYVFDEDPKQTKQAASFHYFRICKSLEEYREEQINKLLC